MRAITASSLVAAPSGNGRRRRTTASSGARRRSARERDEEGKRVREVHQLTVNAKEVTAASGEVSIDCEVGGRSLKRWLDSAD